MEKVYSDVEIEPRLQPVKVEQIEGLIGNEARPDIRARVVLWKGQNAYFDIRVTNTNCRLQANMVENIMKKHQNEKKRQYNNVL